MDHHYVIVVHGTWNPPATPPAWHQRNDSDPSNFCSALNALLDTKHHMGRPVWDGVVGDSFGWTGANRHEDRLAASGELLARLQTVLAADPLARVHLVGHSHGCNVILKCIERYLPKVQEEADRIADAVIEALQADASADPWPRALAAVYGTHAESVAENRRSLIERIQTTMAPLAEKARDEASEDTVRRLMKRFGAAPAGTGFGSEYTFVRNHIKKAWAGSRDGNRLGRVVFLGPAFLFKRWSQRRWYSPSFLVGRAFNLIVAAVAGVFAGYFMMLYFWFVFALLSHPASWFGVPVLRWPAWNPGDWPRWLQGVAAFYGVSLTAILFAPVAGWGLRNVNLYFDETVVTSEPAEAAEPGQALPIESLVVTAGVLDEVLLAFSAEPLVYGTLLPQIREITRAEPRWRLPQRPSGVADMPNRWLLRWAVGLSLWIRAVLLTIGRPAVRVFERLATKFLLSIISAPAYGVPADEFDNALVVATADLDLPRHFAVTRHDVQHLLLATPLTSSTTLARAARYAFVADEAEMAKKIEESWLVKQVRQSTDEIAGRYARFDGGQAFALDQLHRTCVVLEERLKEFAGAVQLTHSAYYSNPTVVEMVADFLATGTTAPPAPSAYAPTTGSGRPAS